MMSVPILIYYGWWISFNCVLAYLKFDFMFRFRRKSPPSSAGAAPYIILCGLLTAVSVRLHIGGPAAMLPDAAFLYFYLVIWYKQNAASILPPFFLVITLSSFMDSYSALAMYSVLELPVGAFGGFLIQVVLSFVMLALLAAVLKLLCKRYSCTGIMKSSGFLYVLLLPCALFCLAVRYEPELKALFDAGSPSVSVDIPWSLFWLSGAFLIFWIIVEVFHKLTVLSLEESEKTQLDEQLKNLNAYLEEAKKRNGQYRSFQHDIKNHFSVLSGLLQKEEYHRAEEYLNTLYTAVDELSVNLSCGNPALDILLSEKISYAVQNGIEVTCDIRIPSEIRIKDTDLCTIFSNAVDNAIQACMKGCAGGGSIALTTKSRHHFLLIEIKNKLRAPIPEIVFGTGLKNMKRTALKYGGTLELSQSDSEVHVSVLLCMDKPKSRT